ncbi:MAG: hypothetical protein HRU36_02720 [Rickettsiales bacterium]|nr:hypothetical protein [Rickettsiales bacterium]
MDTPPDLTEKIMKAIESSDFDSATVSITGITDENDDRYDNVLGSIVKLFSREIVSKEKTPQIISQIIAIYDQNKDSPEQLQKKLDNLLSSFGLVTGKISEDQELVELSSWTDMQLKEKITEIQQKQQELLSSGRSLNPKIGQQLNKLSEEYNKRLGYKGKKITSADTEEKNQTIKEKPTGANSWFVVPSEKELETNIKTHVICGSPIMKVLRDRYQNEYKVKKITDINLDDLANLSADEAYEMKRESSKQKDFVSNYLEPTLVVDQDICAYEIASEFMTDQYTKPELVRIDEETSCYIFKSGYLKDSFNTNTTQHTFSVEGNIIGRFAICLNRKEPDSGRFISDSYDIVEFQDGHPCLYFYSSKGVSALSHKMIEAIKLTTRNTNFDLRIPDPTAIGTAMSKEDIETFIANHQKGNTPSSQDNTTTTAKTAPTENKNKTTATSPSTETENATAKEDDISPVKDNINKKEVPEKENTKEQTHTNSFSETEDLDNEIPETTDTTNKLDQINEKPVPVDVTDIPEQLNPVENKTTPNIQPLQEDKNITNNHEESDTDQIIKEEDNKEKITELTEPSESTNDPNETKEDSTPPDINISDPIKNEEELDNIELNETSEDTSISKSTEIEEDQNNLNAQTKNETTEPTATQFSQEDNDEINNLEELNTSQATEEDDSKEIPNLKTETLEKPDSQDITTPKPIKNEELDNIKTKNKESNTSPTDKVNNSTHIEEPTPKLSEEEKVIENDITNNNNDTLTNNFDNEEEYLEESENTSSQEQLKFRIDRLEKIAINSLEALDQMEKKISKLDELLDTLQEDSSNTANKNKKTTKNEGKWILKKRAATIKKSIKKKKDDKN